MKNRKKIRDSKQEQEKISHEPEISDAEIQKIIDEWNKQLEPDRERLTIESYKSLISELNERLAEAEFIPEKEHFDTASFFEINIRTITALEILNAIKLPEETLFINLQRENIYSQENVKLSADYVNTVLSLLVGQKLYRKKEDILNEIKEASGLCLDEELLFTEDSHVFYPTNNSFLKYDFDAEGCVYDLNMNYTLKRSDFNYSKLFAYLLKNTESDNIDILLNYQLEQYFDNDTHLFFRFLEVCCKTHRKLLKEEAIDIINGWMQWKEKSDKTQTLINTAIGQATKNGDSGYTQARQLLAFYYLLKLGNIEPRSTGVSSVTKLVHFITGTKLTTIQNSDIYKKLLQMPHYKKGEPLIEDLYYVREYFEELKNPLLLEMIDKEIEKTINELPPSKRYKYNSKL